ncbi:tyrosine-type recombinase/integrase [Thiohalobacter sp. IOR34]|uniref:tyrosine-type recombinase/integrase n=1 Tax=Thiohalobacter sp. IOR34 TaxID=3057176 RepID=UPI0025B11B6F|nr:site-specific integrase [Thiohalobacter sp. IOR34]WJW74732.1 tyrosine-type recombinase/integrase [Thiohalobacter sp. IOR34]
MALYKRPNSRYWWVRFTAPDGRQIRESTQTADRKAAQEYEDRRKAELWRQQRLGERPRYRWQQAVERWLIESEGKASLEDLKIHLRWVHTHLYDLYLDTIDRDLIDRITRMRLQEGVSNATVNRMLEVVRAILRRAANDWQWIDRVPAVRMLPEPKRRIRWLTREEADRLLQELPEHLEAMARFSLATGLRERNVTRLEWSQVDLSRRMAWIHPDQAKARKPIAVPLNNEAVLVLRREYGKHPVRVFTYRGRPVDKANTRAWRQALDRAGIEDFRWHDLRHTWASWHVQNGTPLHVLQELGGWSCYSMVQRYAHLSAEHLAGYADNISRICAVTSTFSGTHGEDEKEQAAG